MNGALIYRGPSMLDGKPIIVIATGLAKGSTNTKTGALIQTWIMREDVSPVAALHSGDDASICGQCPHRGTIEDGHNIGRSCYVVVFQAPLNVWKSYHKGLYPQASDIASLFAGRKPRLGSYGDPAAVPVHIWEQVTSQAIGFTGYTHQWRKFPELAPYCMASVDSPVERLQANMLGFRTFRVRGEHDPILELELTCPASAEAGKRTTCFDCQLCKGKTSRAKKDVVIMAHGAKDRVNSFIARAA